MYGNGRVSNSLCAFKMLFTHANFTHAKCKNYLMNAQLKYSASHWTRNHECLVVAQAERSKYFSGENCVETMKWQAQHKHHRHCDHCAPVRGKACQPHLSSSLMLSLPQSDLQTQVEPHHFLDLCHLYKMRNSVTWFDFNSQSWINRHLPGHSWEISAISNLNHPHIRESIRGQFTLSLFLPGETPLTHIGWT